MPPSWGKTRVVLLPVDPHSVHVYWELAPHDQVKAAQRLGRARQPARPVLRFHETTGAQAPFDIDIELSAGKCYVHLERPEKSYCVELGLKGGRFVSLARSNVAQTPAAGPSARLKESIPAGAGRPAAREPAPDRIAAVAAAKAAESIGPLAAGKGQPPETPPPIDFAEALQKKLAALYAATQWPAPRTRAAPAGSPDLSEQPPPLGPGGRGFAGRDAAGVDLTGRNEAGIAWGCSSGPAIRREEES